jgi:hypothetical protein
MAMFTWLPIDAAALPRVHVEPRRPDGTLRLLDRFTGQQLIVYTPRYTQQFRAGHLFKHWYIRPLTHVGIEPVSQGYPTARAAVEDVTTGCWSIRSERAGAAQNRIPVIWTT